jgi:hypothetical protein
VCKKDRFEQFNNAFALREREGEEVIMVWVAPDVYDESVQPSTTIFGVPVYIDKSLRPGRIRVVGQR